MIKMKYRLALILSQYLRDYQHSNKILKHLKKYCNTYQKLDLFKEANALYEKQSELINNRDKGKFKIKEIIEKYVYPAKAQDAMTQIADYINDKIEIRWIQSESGVNLRRGLFAKATVNKGELLIANQAYIIQKDVGTSSIEKVVDQLNQKQRCNPLCTTLQLNYLCGGPI